MSLYEEELTPYPEVNRLLAELRNRVRDVLKDRFVGMYLYGSLATGDFRPESSDVDFLVVTDEYLDFPIIRKLEEMHLELASIGSNWAKKLEGAYVPKPYLRRHDPDHLPVPTLNEGEFYLAVLGPDWVIQRHDLRTIGKTVAGPPIAGWIDEVRPEDLRWAIREILEGWWLALLDHPTRLYEPGYQPYAVLSMCRCLYTMEMGTTVTKSRASEWARQTLSPDWRDLIDRAAAWHWGDESADVEKTRALIRLVIERSRRRMEQNI